MKTPWYMRQKLPVVLVAGLGGLFTVVDVGCAQPWAANIASSYTAWKALAVSADGTKMVATANGRMYPYGGVIPPAPIYVSSNAGVTWVQASAPSNNWFSVACSADGTKLVAVANIAVTGFWGGDGLIYTSPDSGTTWTPTSAPSNSWSAVASSADGVRLVAVAGPQQVRNGTNYDSVGGGAIYRSPDSGATWTPTTAPSNNWTSVASSADGARLVAVVTPQRVWDGANWNYVGDAAIYRSVDSGATWSRTSAPSNIWSCVASSADGTKLVAVAGSEWEQFDGLVYTSSDSGATWTPTSAPSNSWFAVASSADGTKLVAAAAKAASDSGGPGLIYTSSNSGATWTATDAPRGMWTTVASSADGYRVVAGGIATSLCTFPYAGPWRLADAPEDQLGSVASSADGTKLTAVSWWSGTIYTSGDCGMTWAPTTAPSNRWASVASSADGTKLVAAATTDPNYGGDGLIYTSSNSGASWTPTSAPTNNWTSAASSVDGARLVAVAWLVWGQGGYVGDGVIYRSLDSGVTWSRTTAPSNAWSSVACSADGTKLVAVASHQLFWNGTNHAYDGDGAIYRSLDSGASWTRTSAPTNVWTSVASSADGTELVAGAYWAGLIYTSSNSGATWTQTSAPTENWRSVASSADGTKLVAVGGEGVGEVIISTNAGVTWTPASPMPAAGWWLEVACSADGSNIVAVGDAICTLRPPAPAPPLPPSPELAVGLSGANLGLSWLVPSTRFVLQQNSDLASANWTDLPTTPNLNFTNLHYEVTVSPSPGSRFYRLKLQ